MATATALTPRAMVARVAMKTATTVVKKTIHVKKKMKTHVVNVMIAAQTMIHAIVRVAMPAQLVVATVPVAHQNLTRM